jgi:uncharacterized integral membrane protein
MGQQAGNIMITRNRRQKYFTYTVDVSNIIMFITVITTLDADTDENIAKFIYISFWVVPVIVIILSNLITGKLIKKTYKELKPMIGDSALKNLI